MNATSTQSAYTHGESLPFPHYNSECVQMCKRFWLTQASVPSRPTVTA